MMKQTRKKKQALPKKVKKVRKESAKKKQSDGQQELTRIWDEDLCE